MFDVCFTECWFRLLLVLFVFDCSFVCAGDCGWVAVVALVAVCGWCFGCYLCVLLLYASRGGVVLLGFLPSAGWVQVYCFFLVF